MFSLIISDDELKEKVRVIINDKMVEIFDGFQNYYDKGNKYVIEDLVKTFVSYWFYI